MKIILADVEEQLSKLALSIQVDPYSWKEWTGLCLELDQVSDINTLLNDVFSERFYEGTFTHSGYTCNTNPNSIACFW